MRVDAAKLVLPIFQVFGACGFILAGRPFVSFFLCLTAGLSLTWSALRGKR